jgi:hypothetical protein
MRLLFLASLLALAYAEYAIIASSMSPSPLACGDHFLTMFYSLGTAHRYSKWVVEREAYADETISFKISLEC